jgi:hypothetical protein
MTKSSRSLQHPHDADLPPKVIRKRRRQRRFARIVIVLAVLFGIGGWALYSNTIRAAINIREDSLSRVIIAWGLLIASSIMLVLGLWYLLLAQVQRIARMVEGEPDPERGTTPLCPNCGWSLDPPDRFCRHCGKPLGASTGPPGEMKK